MSARPFKILGVHHLAIGNADIQRLRHLWGDVLGLSLGENFVLESENVIGCIARLEAGAHTVEVDLLQPLNAESKPAPHLPPLNHIAFWVDHLAEAVTWLVAQGVRFTPGGIRAGANGRMMAFIHPKATDEYPIGGEGVMIELVQAPSEVIVAFEIIAQAI
ncbi:MAG TPA: VOC family protein [Rhodocyclaceae bacterium]|nr:VOC family protein [Rhodocyclaceae bacterium]